ncbi:RHS repeat-associated core domain-containing protein [Micromonospora sp. NPDC049559]|uniref:RHS repeat domain-containing protein n=1 Tax=Micromonospora sp. NPDC049559 TaxID=3155923 RepID=UPI00342355A4
MRRAAALSVALVASAAVVLPAEAVAAAVTPMAPQKLPSVPVTAVPLRPYSPPAPRAFSASAVSWPAASTADVAVARTSTRAGKLPVWVSGAQPGTVRVEMLGKDAAAKAGVEGVLLRIARTGGAPAANSGTASTTATVPAGDPVSVTVSYDGFRHAYGGDWASRLRLVRMPACAATTPDATACRTGTVDFPSRNNLGSGQVTAQVRADSGGTVYALAAAPEGSTGDYKATSLAPSGQWQVSAQNGSFTWSYPMRVPPVPGQLAPELSADYNSGSVDGRVATTNNQTSWLGEGWNLAAGFVERRYRGCAEDLGGNQGQTVTGDLCWIQDNAVLSFGDRSGQLVRIGESNSWRLTDDDGTRVDHLYGTDNGDDNGEHWRLTTTDGTQYYFGLNRMPDGRPVTNAAWSVPVAGNNPNEPCYVAGNFGASFCQQAYRWNLDYVVDGHGNTITYTYAPESNKYAQNLGQATTAYTRGGTLARIDYGTRVGDGSTAPARVVFDAADRCVPGANCASRTAASWPDVPWDQNCDTATCPEKWAPTFWSTKRLASVTTQVWGGSAYRDVERWTFDQTYPAPGDGTSPAMWLRGIGHSGLVGSAVSTQPVTFDPDPNAQANRVDWAPDGLPPTNKNRINAIHTESGGVIGVTYAPTNCSPTTLPAPDTNTARCFPVRWAPDRSVPINDWFHKYVVATVSLVDRVGGNPTQFTNYDYEGGAAWAYDDDPLTPEKYRSWSQWRGYEKVLVRKGDPKDPGNPIQSATRYQYFRGMNGDRLAAGGTKAVRITDSQGAALDDARQLAGFLREEITYNGVGGAEVTGTVNDPWQKGPTAAQGPYQAYVVNVGATHTRTTRSSGTPRKTETYTAYTDEGLPTSVDDRGDVGDPGDDRCTRTTYARNDTSWLIDLPSRVETVGVSCSATAAFPQDTISDVRTYYDGGALGAAPGAGNATKVEELKAPRGEVGYVTTAQLTYDPYGRVKDSYDALAHKTSTTYAPATGLPTAMTVTNPLGHVTTTTLEPAWNQSTAVVDANLQRTDTTYDGLGRVTAVWGPLRSKARGQGPSVRYAYGFPADASAWISTQTLKPNGNYVTSYTLYDGFLRERQSQAPSPQGGRVLADTIYDARGLVSKRNAAYYNEQIPGTVLVAPQENQLPTQTVNVYDGAERLVRETYEKLDQPQWSTVTDHNGDSATVTPPPGGTPTTTLFDARGQVTEIREYAGGTAGTYSTRRWYTKAGKLAKIVDAVGNQWLYSYDVAGNNTRVDDPDNGVSTMTYDAADQLVSSTDARSRTVEYKYDDLGRKYETRSDGVTAATWTYDTLAKGQLTRTTRYVGTTAYVNEVIGYNGLYQPTGQQTIIPATKGKLAGTYTTTTQYLSDGSVGSVGLPKLSDQVGAETIVYDYDDLGLPYATKGKNEYVTATTYTALGELTQLQLGVAAKRSWQTSYFEEGTRRLAQSVIQREVTNGLYVDEVAYAYDPMGNNTRIETTTSGSALERQCFAYDGLRRLTEAWTTTAQTCGAAGSAVGGPAPYWNSYGTDAIGRRLTQTRHGVSGAADTKITMTYPAVGQPRPHAPATVATSGPSSPATANGSYAYDAMGNTTSRPTAVGDQKYTWDADGQLTAVTTAGVTTTYVNTPDNERLLAEQGDKAATLYLVSGEVRLDKTTGTVSGVRYYTQGDRTVAVRTAEGLAYLSASQQGTPDLMVDAATLQFTKRRFDPFGVPRGAAPASWPGERGFVGGTSDAASGLTRLGVRDYDAAAGKFLSVDPILQQDKPQQFNAYSYAVNNPTTFSDPTGKAPEDKPGYCVVWRGDCGFDPVADQGTPSGFYTPEQVQKAKAKNNAPQPSCNKYGDCIAGKNGPSKAAKAKQRAREQAEQARKAAAIRKAANKHLGRDVKVDSQQLAYRGSVSICVSGSGGVIVVVGVEVCVNFDSTGLSVSRGRKIGAELGAGVEAQVAVKFSSERADKISASPSWSFEGGPELKVLGGGEIKGGIEISNADGSPASYIELGIGGGAKASAGGAYYNEGENTGYLAKW